MGSKLARRNKALKKMQSPTVESSPKEIVPGDGKPGVYRLRSAEGHYVALHAEGKTHAHTRWTEFYPKAQVSTCEYIGN